MNRSCFLLVAIYFALGALILSSAPLGSFPDEKNHYAYTMFVRTHDALPRMDDSGISVAFHPPLYYFSCALVIHPDQDPWTNTVRCRIFSLLLGGVTLILIYKTALLISPENLELALLSTAFAALNPQFIFIHSGISNIAMTSLTCGLTTYLLIHIVTIGHVGPKQTAALGAGLGLALLSRSVSIYLIPVILLGIVYRTKKAGALTIQTMFKTLLPVCLFAAVISAWWFLWSWQQFGDPFQFQIGREKAGGSFTPSDPVSFRHLLQTCAFLHASFWAYFGRMEFHAGVTEYTIYLILEVLALIGIFQISKEKKQEEPFEKIPFLLLMFSGFLANAQVILFNMKIASPQGRYLYMAIIPVCIGLGAGILKILPQQNRKPATVALILFLFLLCLYLLLFYWFRVFLD
ncbi:DUF2142 domain-containing protein [bacterium]|nr:DUF2142 domain-containing protein [bacterium]